MIRLFPGYLALLFLAVFSFTSCDDDDDTVSGLPVIGTITDFVEDDDRFTALRGALERTGLDETLDGVGANATVFAPTDDAFRASGIDLSTVTDDELSNLLRYHVILNTYIRSEDIAEGETVLTTAADENGAGQDVPLFVNRSGSTITFNDGATIIVPDVEVVNGIIHAVDQVIMPPSITTRAVDDGRFTTLVAALQRTGLDQTLSEAGNFTVFAPTDDAFDALGLDLSTLSDEDLTQILLYHVLGEAVSADGIASGNSFPTTLADGPEDSNLSLFVNKGDDGVRINDEADVIVTDVAAFNGVIHAIDEVLSTQSIVDFATKAEGTSSLAAALSAAGLVDDLSGDGPFTVFAPTNDAFTAAGDTIIINDTTGTRLDLLTPAQVEGVLTYHVLANTNVNASELTDTVTVSPLFGQSFTVNPAEDGVTITDATNQPKNIILTDIQGTNGVIHLIDGILVPEL